MGYRERQQIIKELQDLRKTKIVTHINSDRRIPPVPNAIAPPALITRMGTEAQPFFYEALREIGKNEEIDLFLYTGGGQTDSVWPLVSIFREYGEKFNVLVTYKAHSAGTLVCLGADNIIIGEAGELSPVDPKTGNEFNPVDDIDNNRRKAISVEEVTSYFDLVKDPGKDINANNKENKAVDKDLAFKVLARKVHPLALGNVNRSHKQIRELAKRLLQLHIRDDADANRINDIVNALTQGRYSHTDIINRKEAKELLGEDIVKYTSDREQNLFYRLYSDYANSIEMLRPYILGAEIGNNQQEEVRVIGGYIETEETSYIFRAICTVYQTPELPPQFQVQLQPGQPLPMIPGLPKRFAIETSAMGWAKNEEGV